MIPQVSIIIPAYNTETYIAHAIQSVLSQTLHNIEVIVVDDASTDKTVDVINGFSDPRLVKIFNARNMGAAGARNRALSVAKGDWVAVLDSDDWFAPERLERLVHVAMEQNADMIADDLSLIQDGQNEPWSTLIQESGHEISAIRLVDLVTFVSTTIYGQQGLQLGISKPLFRRRFLTQHEIKYDESLKISEDFWFDMECLKNDAQFYLIPESYYFYRSRPGSLVDNNRVRHLTDDKRKILEFIKDNQSQLENTEEKHFLLRNLKIINRYLAYYSVVEPFKNRQYLLALKALPFNFTFFSHLLTRLPGILNRRLQYYIFGNKLAFEMMNQTKS